MVFIGFIGICWVISGMIGRADPVTYFLGFIMCAASSFWFAVFRAKRP